jgi:hypothetical protein
VQKQLSLPPASIVSCLAYSLTLGMEAIYSSEMLGCLQTTNITNQKTICLIYSHLSHSCDIQPKPNKHPPQHIVKFNFSPLKETIISFICDIKLHSLGYKNAFLL